MRLVPSRTLLAIAALGLIASLAHADTTPEPPTIRVHGEATETSQPDRVEIDIGVVTHAPTSRAAASANARELQAVLAALRAMLGATAELQTTAYTLRPEYQTRDRGEPTISGYTASNTVRVTLDDLSRLAAVIDTAAQAGANQIERIRYSLKDELAVQQRALSAAALDARAKARAVAHALGLAVVGVVAVVENEASTPPRDIAFARAASASTPIVPGSIETRASVTVDVAVESRPPEGPLPSR